VADRERNLVTAAQRLFGAMNAGRNGGEFLFGSDQQVFRNRSLKETIFVKRDHGPGKLWLIFRGLAKKPARLQTWVDSCI
jgi:hypothetical protein